MRYIVILETPSFIHYLRGIVNKNEDVVCLVPGNATPSGIPILHCRTCDDDPYQKDTYRKLAITTEDRVILITKTSETADAVLHAILSVCEIIPIVSILSDSEKTLSYQQDNISYLLLNDLLSKNLEREWLYIRNRGRTNRIRDLTNDAENILILTQHDPDPDALASGLALKVLLNRNRVTAPIGSFGKVTRSENLSMMRLLDIRYTVVNPESLNNYSMIAMVDVQPPYFGDRVSRADIVFDHHPQPGKYDSSFKDIRTEYGATSTILTEYLMSNHIKLNQRLATALLYGIKSDTLMLGREVNAADIEAFTHLHALANHNLIRQMEHPSLDPDEVSLFIRALKKQKLIDKVLFAHLGRVKKEDIIPRLADFCLQMAGAEWSVVSGLFQRDLVISIRNVGYVKSAAQIVKDVFADSSVAGGHRTMAKAVIPLNVFKKLFHITNNSDIEDKIVDVFLKVIL